MGAIASRRARARPGDRARPSVRGRRHPPRAHDALASLMDWHEAIGDVRSLGLLVGVELVAEGERREPALAVADRVLNGMREKRVLIGTTGRDGNVLKIRPPLVITANGVDLLVGRLDEVLRAR
jgi:4-aminobutyrate aminotransferase-like enzyme